MKMNIISDNTNPLLSRREVEFQVIHDGGATPRKIDVAGLLSAKLNTSLDKMVIEDYTTHFGKNTSEGICFVYEDKEAMIRAEPTKLLNPKKRIGDAGKPKEKEKTEVKEAPKEEEKPTEVKKTPEEKAEVKVEKPKVEEKKAKVVETPKEEGEKSETQDSKKE
ncbi:MAG: hypothetical protein GOV01_00190 [Candidatus Altiarchaeota archaeon]|nr:hypothetical protein [Candidatus Altiarchaeota archaeon]